MKDLDISASQTPSSLLHYPATPLWQRVPTRDENGKNLIDFMILLRGFSRKPPKRQRSIINEIEQVCQDYRDWIVFVELNARINTLWFSCRPVKDAMTHISYSLVSRVPEAVLIAQNR
ncbi:MAG: hypothetical protein EP297_09900 [Gammaproteobacteria bacterium]|nr:MAG: hypothetical protein EP297_09900 [Gammaproteobacteria bacterium]